MATSILLLRGRSTPAIRAIVSSCPQLSLVSACDAGSCTLRARRRGVGPTLQSLHLVLTDALTFTACSSPTTCLVGRARTAQDERLVARDRDRVLRMGRAAPVLRHGRPAVVLDPHLGTAGVHHRLDREDHSLANRTPAIADAVVRHLRPPRAAALRCREPTEVARDRSPPARRTPGWRPTDRRRRRPMRLRDSRPQRAGHLHQALVLGSDLADRDGAGGSP